LRSKILKADLLLTVRYDRFSRNLELALGMITELKKYGVEFNTIEQNNDTSSPESLLIHVINLVLPQIDNDRRALNTKQGMRRAQKEGHWMGTAPKGYDNIQRNGEKFIEPNDDAKHIIWAFQQLNTGLYAIEEIRKQLWKKGFKISKSAFHKLVRNPVYIGKIMIKAYKDEPEQIADGIHQPLIDEELFLSVQDVLDGKKRTAKPKNKRDERYPLRGFLECPKCGKPLTASFSKGRSQRYGYYHCQKNCKERYSLDEANTDFLRYLNNYKINDEVLTLYYLVLQDIFKNDKKERAKEASQIDELIQGLNNKLDSLLDKNTDDLLSQSDYERGKKRYEEQIYSLESQKQELELEQKDFMTTVQYTFGLLRDLPKYYEQSPIEVKHKILGSIFPEKLIYQNKKYRTAQINSVVALMCSNINAFGEVKEKRIAENDNPSFRVTSTG